MHKKAVAKSMLPVRKRWPPSSKTNPTKRRILIVKSPHPSSLLKIWAIGVRAGERITPHDVNLGGEPRSQLRRGPGSVGRSSARLHGRAVGIEYVGGSRRLVWLGAAWPRREASY